MSESNAALRAQMFSKASEGNEDDGEEYYEDYASPEEELTSLIERNEECRKEVADIKALCLKYENIPPHSLDEM